MELIRASRPQEMKSSTSQRAGSSRTFLKTMYLTSGAKVITRGLRTCTLPVRLYSVHSASASSAETRRRLVVEEGFIGGGSLGRGFKSDGRSLYRGQTRLPESPVRGNCCLSHRIRPGERLRAALPQLLRPLLAEREACQRARQLRVLVHGHAGLARALEDRCRDVAAAGRHHAWRAVARVAQRRGGARGAAIAPVRHTRPMA